MTKPFLLSIVAAIVPLPWPPAQAPQGQHRSPWPALSSSIARRFRMKC